MSNPASGYCVQYHIVETPSRLQSGKPKDKESTELDWSGHGIHGATRKPISSNIRDVVWENGTDLQHQQTGAGAQQYRVYHVTQSGLLECVPYEVRIVPLFIYDSVLYIGAPSQPLLITLPCKSSKGYIMHLETGFLALKQLHDISHKHVNNAKRQT